jgi:Ca2+/Na+ antiporter
MLAIVVIWFLLCKRRPEYGTPAWVDNMMAIFAASCAFSWHSHIHMGMVMIPFLVFFVARRLPPMKSLELDIWVFAIPTAMLLGYVLSIVLFLTNVSAIENLGNFLIGLTGLAVYMFLAIKGLKREDLQ